MAVKNLVSGVLAQSITTSTTNVLVNIAENTNAQGITDFFPNPPFYITIMPKTPTIGVANRLDSEILQVTAVGSDQSGNATLTCVRGQRDTTAKSFDAGSIVTVGVYADDAVFLGGEGSAVGTPSPWVESSDIKNGAITTDKIANGAVKSAKIDWTTLKTGKPTEVGSGIASRTITANSVGFIVINMACAFEQYCEVYLNGTSLGSSKSGGTTTFTWFQTTVFVAKGDVVQITTSDNGGNAQIAGVKFVPIS